MYSNMVDITDIKQNLLNLGLQDLEISIYLSLLEYESLSILELSNVSGIPRTTVYRVCKSLIEKGFATETIEANGVQVVVVRPKSLDFLIKKKEADLIDYTNSLRNLQEVFKETYRSVPKTQIKYYREKRE